MDLLTSAKVSHKTRKHRQKHNTIHNNHMTVQQGNLTNGGGCMDLVFHDKE